MKNNEELKTKIDTLTHEEFNFLFLLTIFIQTLENKSVDLKEKHEQELKETYNLVCNDTLLIEYQKNKYDD